MAELIDYEQSSGVLLGSGYDLLKRSVKLSPLHDVHMQTMVGGPCEIDLSFIENASSLGQFLKVGVEGAYDALAFKASVKSRFVDETQINKYSLLFVVHCKCIKDVEILEDPRLCEQALTLAGNGEFMDFRNSYGDYYVATITRGGELFGLIQIGTRSESEREQLRMDLGASFLDWSARGSFEERLARSVSSRNIRVQARIAGISDFRAPTTVSALLRLAEEFPMKVQASGTPIKVGLRPISELPEYTGAVRELDTETRYALWSLSTHYLEYRMLWNNVAFMLSPAGGNRFDFDSVGKATIAAERSKVEGKLKEIESLSENLLHERIEPDDGQIKRFIPALVFERSLRLPNPIEWFELPNLHLYPLRKHTRGDTDMKGHNPSIAIDAVLSSPQHRRLDVRLKAKMREDRKDWTTFEDSSTETIKDLRNTGLKIVDFQPKNGTIRQRAGKDDHDWHWYRGTGLIKRALCRSDVRGKETGRIGAKEIELHPVKVVVAPLKEDGEGVKLSPAQLQRMHKGLHDYWLQRIPLQRPTVRRSAPIRRRTGASVAHD